MIKFMYNGIKVEKKLYKAWYSKGSYTEQSGIVSGTITIYAKDYARLPDVEGLSIKNETDSMTDYFDSDKIRVSPSNPYYELVHEAFEKQEEKRQARFNKRMNKIS